MTTLQKRTILTNTHKSPQHSMSTQNPRDTREWHITTKWGLPQEGKAGLTFKKTQWTPAYQETKGGKPCGHFNVCINKRLTKISCPFVTKTRNWREHSQLDKEQLQKPTADATLTGKSHRAFSLRSKELEQSRGWPQRGSKRKFLDWWNCSVSWLWQETLVCFCLSKPEGLYSAESKFYDL